MKTLDYEQELLMLTNEREKLAIRYAKERKAYGEKKSELDIIYASKIKEINEIKRNAGYETGLIYLMAISSAEVREMYKDFITHLNNYKAVEKMIDAIESKIMARQSIMRFNRHNDGGGF